MKLVITDGQLRNIIKEELSLFSGDSKLDYTLNFTKLVYSAKYSQRFFFNGGDMDSFNEKLKSNEITPDMINSVTFKNVKNNKEYTFKSGEYKIGSKIGIPKEVFLDNYPEVAKELINQEQNSQNNNNKSFVNKQDLQSSNDDYLKVQYLKKNESGVPQLITNILKSIYEPLGMWGENSCEDKNIIDSSQRGVGVINIYPVDNISNWSILNFFDTNYKVIGELLDMYIKYSENKNTTIDNFKDWLDFNKLEIFGPDSKHLSTLVELNRTVLESGLEREKRAIELFKDKRGIPKNSNLIKTQCLGNLDDRRSGVDFTYKGVGFQIKPYYSYTSDTRHNHLIIKTKGMKNYIWSKKLDYILFIKDHSDDLIIIQNKNYKIDYEGSYDFVTYRY